MKQLFLINISGHDKPGVTAMLMQTLSTHGADVLDIGQAVIHNSLSLGVLIAAGEHVDTESLKHEIEAFADEQEQMLAQVQQIDLNDYRCWVLDQEKPRHIVTLLGRSIRAEHIAKISHIVASHGLNIDKINRLSGRLDIEGDINNSKACVTFSLRGEASNLTAMRTSLLATANELNVDIAYQEDNIFRRYRRLVVFDMDSTLIEAEVIDELAKEAGVGDQVSIITERAMCGEIDFKESFRQRVALLEGLSETVLEQIAKRIKLTEGAEKLITTLRSLGYKTAILSGGFSYFAKRLQNKLGIDYIYANELIIENGKITGQVSGDIIDGQRKAELLQEIAKKEKINLEQVIAVGDGANDLPMLSIAGLGIAFRAKPIVKQTAKQSISNLGLDGILYLIGFRDRDWFSNDLDCNT